MLEARTLRRQREDAEGGLPSPPVPLGLVRGARTWPGGLLVVDANVRVEPVIPTSWPRRPVQPERGPGEPRYGYLNCRGANRDVGPGAGQRLSFRTTEVHRSKGRASPSVSVTGGNRGPVDLHVLACLPPGPHSDSGTVAHVRGHEGRGARGTVDLGDHYCRLRWDRTITSPRAQTDGMTIRSWAGGWDRTTIGIRRRRPLVQRIRRRITRFEGSPSSFLPSLWWVPHQWACGRAQVRPRTTDRQPPSWLLKCGRS